MSRIDPVQRNALLATELCTTLNAPASELKRDDAAPVEPVKASNRSELLGDRRELKPLVDAETDRLVMQVVDKHTEEVIFQAPPEITLEMARDVRRQQKRHASR